MTLDTSERSSATTAIVFDLDGVLVDSEPYWQWGFSAGLLEILQRRGFDDVNMAGVDLDAFVGGRVRDTVPAILRALGVAARLAPGDAAAISREVVAAVTARFVATPAPIAASVATALELAAAGHPLAVATSSALSFAHAAVRAIGLEEVLPVRVSSYDLAHGKPDPEVYHHALAALSTDCRGAIAIEDSPVGLTAAVRAGLRTVWLVDAPGSGADVPPDPGMVTDALADRGAGDSAIQLASLVVAMTAQLDYALVERAAAQPTLGPK